MSAPTTPLSAAATRVLADLRADKGPSTSVQTISRLAVKELVLRGYLRVTDVKKRRMRKPLVTVSTGFRAAAKDYPAPLAALALAMRPTDGMPLSELISLTRAHHPALFTQELKAEILADLKQRGYIEDRKRKALGLFPRTYPAPTPAGEQAAAWAHRNLDAANALPNLAKGDQTAAAKAAMALGPLVLLAPAGLATTASLAKGDWRGRTTKTHDQFSSDVGFETYDGFDVLTACAGALTDLVDSIGDDFRSLDDAFDAVADAVDSGIDSGVTDGGGDGGDGGGGDGGGGGD